MSFNVLTMKGFHLFFRKNTRAVLVFLYVTLLFFLIYRSAWISDDAAITLRTVLNFINGFGPTFNVEERVQAYTHPLWFVLLALGTFVVGDPFVAGYYLPLLISAFVLLILALSCRGLLPLVASFFFVMLSKAFVDFSTSGLENPLSAFLLLMILMLAAKKHNGDYDYLWSGFCFGLVLLNRLDLVLIAAPVFLYCLWYKMHWRQRFWALLVPGLMLLLWFAFSIFYYGYAFPNTAYAKLGTGISRLEILAQGLEYILHLQRRDPVTFLVVTVGIVLGFYRQGLLAHMAAGMLLYVAYVVWVGGDFMEGRFLTVPFVFGVLILSREIIGLKKFAFALGVLMFLSPATIDSNVLSGSEYLNRTIYANGIADERGFYYQFYGLSPAYGHKVALEHPAWNPRLYKLEDVKVMCGGMGFGSVFLGPNIHIVDICALADPLLSKLPSDTGEGWRIGHFIRPIPEGYLDSVGRGDNLIIDSDIYDLYEEVRLLTRADVFSRERMLLILGWR